ncbi:DNA cytosine methyltransferase [Corynebacterium pygosceleis]|uniref:DNA cytosine methyltransferase n=1 Tax=Corynebacterium pygosceleis TaxID=2800406 RepID=UPI00190557B3|nr:DNA cytosine methyltransferase [Corynebacterium pygosceleis]MCL0120873.1 DNA cytosine methyltransferase [Corynebacterium pygosceleis]
MKIDVRRPLAVDLFAGAGGLSMGLEQAGYEIAASVEYDPVHAAVHEFNFTYGKTFARDVSTMTGREIREKSEIGDREISLVAGGPPCQGVSMIGRRMIDDPRNALLNEYVRLVVELQPRFFLMENVAGLTVGNHRQLLAEVVELLEMGGYKIVLPYKVLQAADYGTPQSRRRLILLGARRGVPLPRYPEATVRPRNLRGTAPLYSDLPVGPSVIDAIGDLPDADRYEALLHDDHVSVTWPEAGSIYAQRLRCKKIDPADFSHRRPFDPNMLTSSTRTVHTAESIARFSSTLPGTTESISRYLRLHSDGICNTLRAGTASDRGAYTAPRPIHPLLPRVITVREAARLHGYPDWFRFHVTKWNGFRQIGNSVPIPLGRAVGAALLQTDGVTPIKGKKTSLGDPALLYFNAGQAHDYFGLSERVIPQRNRKRG